MMEGRILFELIKDRVNYHVVLDKTIGDVINELNVKQLQLIDGLVSQASHEFRDKDPYNVDMKAWVANTQMLCLPWFLDLTADQQTVAYYLVRLAASEAYAKASKTQKNEKAEEEDHYHAFMQKARERMHKNVDITDAYSAYPTIRPTKIIFSGPKCIVFWNDYSKTIVSRSENDPYDEHAAFCAAYAKRMFGSTTRVKKMVNRVAVGYPDKKMVVQILNSRGD